MNNTADSAKNVKYAASAGSATSATSSTNATQIKTAKGNIIQFEWDGSTSKIVIAVNGIVVRNI